MQIGTALWYSIGPVGVECVTVMNELNINSTIYNCIRKKILIYRLSEPNIT